MGGTVFAPMYQDLLYNNIAAYQIPKNKKAHNKLMSQIYHFDPIAGPAVDLYAEMPWSGFDLTGIDDPAIRHIYEDAFSNLRMEYYFPQMTANYLVYGRICLHLLFDQTKGIWTNFILHNDDDVEIVPVPFFNEDPLVNFLPPPETKEFILSKDPRTQVYLQNIPASMIQMIKSGKSIPLDVSNTLYLPRRTLINDPSGTSLFSRIIGLITLERALMNASTVKAQRNAGPIRVLKMGKEGWLPTDEEMANAISSIMMAEEDPVAAVVGFKGQDTSIDLMSGSGQDGLWKISEEYDFIQNAKFKALGISEQMMAGDATYNNMEQALSIFLERIKTLRQRFERKILIEKVCEPLAKAHGFYKKQKVLNPRLKQSDTRNLQETSDAQLILPTIGWHKPLEPRMDQSLVDLYKAAEEVGLPVTMRQWGAATGISLSDMGQNLEDDLLVRKQIKQWKDQVDEDGLGSADLGTSEDFGGGDLGGGGDMGDLGGPDEGGGPGGMEDGKPVMEKVTPEDTSVVDNIPPPPTESSYTKFKSSSLKGHPLLSGSRFGNVALARIREIEGFGLAKVRTYLAETELNSVEKAWIKYAASYSDLRITLDKKEIQHIARELARHKVLRNNKNVTHLARLSAISPEASLNLLSGK
jgi:hypothetical protein